MMGRKPIAVVVVAVFASLSWACSEPASDDGNAEPTEGVTTATGGQTTGPGGTTTSGPDSSAPGANRDPEADTVIGRLAGADWFLGTLPDTPTAADPNAEPIVIGMINQEDTPLGSFPEIRRAVEGGVAFANAELGGVGGRPIELRTCVTSFDANQSAACAQKMVAEDVVALVGGIDVTSSGSVPVLEQNGIPQLGGIPANLVEQRSDVVFFFSGGITGGLAAFLARTAEEGGDTAVLAYGEFESFAVAAEDYAAPVAEELGIDLELISFPLVATDFLPVLTRAAESNPDSIIVAAAGTSCAPIMKTYRDLGIEAQLYLVGACADPDIVEATDGAYEGVLFNSEGPPLGVETEEGDLFNAINELYADNEGNGAGTVGMRGFFNLYGTMSQLGPDGVTRDAILAAVRDSKDAPSFWGHPYTCDGAQVDGLPALCAPQQSILRVERPGYNVTVNEDWYDTVELFARAL